MINASLVGALCSAPCHIVFFNNMYDEIAQGLYEETGLQQSYDLFLDRYTCYLGIVFVDQKVNLAANAKLGKVDARFD
jgi:hypothetical protein